jgi:hypothetical protein
MLDDSWDFFLCYLGLLICFLLGVLGLVINNRGRVTFNYCVCVCVCVCVCFALNGW